MDVTLEFNQAAFIHNVTKEDIKFTFDTARYEGSIDEDESDKITNIWL